MACKLLLFLITSALTYTAESSSDKAVKISENYTPSVLSDVLRIFSLNQKCISKGIFECLRFKLLRTIDRAVSTTDVLEVTHGVYFVKNPDVTAYNTSDSRAFLDTRISIGQFLVEKLKEFLKTHLLQVKRNHRYYHLLINPSSHTTFKSAKILLQIQSFFKQHVPLLPIHLSHTLSIFRSASQWAEDLWIEWDARNH